MSKRVSLRMGLSGSGSFGSKTYFFAYLLTAILSQPSLAFATDSSYTAFPKFAGSDSLDRLREAEVQVSGNAAIKEVLKKDGFQQLSVDARISESGIETTKFKHYYKGLEVLGSMAVHHVGKSGVDVQNALAKFDLDVVPSVSPAAAVSIAQSYLSDRDLKAVPALQIFPSDEGNSARLIYSVNLKGSLADGGHELLIDARSGELIADLPKMITIAPVQVYSTRERQLLRQASNRAVQCQVLDADGSPQELNPKACQHVVKDSEVLPGADETGRRAASNSSKVLEYFLSTHNRNSFDAKGTDVISVVHVGHEFDNAFWNDEEDYMAYGDGDGTLFGDFTRALDVAGHEMTHGVISKTANLIYRGDSGALNEAFADFFGKMIANDGDWTVGKEIFLKPEGDRNGIRDLENPGRFTDQAYDSQGHLVKRPYPAHVKDAAPVTNSCGPRNDYCWVHFNATIPGHAFYLVHQAVGRSVAERVLYTAVAQYVTPRTTFKTIGSAVQSACNQLYNARTCSQVKSAMAEAGI